ncbi:MAG TPA: hypothetical protein VFT55_05375 [Planctomycetota bacterium]|nr:hypothetical protein [Planctomycetota bacterium]
MKTFANVTVVLALLAAAHAQQTAAPDPVARAHQDIASLIPADTVALARLASIDELLRHALHLTNAVGEDPTNVTAEHLLDEFGPIPGNRELIDRRLPAVIAVSMPRATPPSPVLLLPATDPAAYVASLPPLAVPPVVAGSYVAVPLGAKYEKPAAPSTALGELPDGLFAVYADAEKLVAAFGTVIGAALSAAKPQFAKQLESNSPGLDGEELADLYLEGVRTVLGCAKEFRFRAGYRDGALEMFSTLQVKAGSDMDGWSGAPIDSSAFGGPPTGKGALEVLMAADWQKLWPRLQPLIDRLADVYPKETGDLLRNLTAEYAPLQAAFGPFAAVDGDLFAPDGMNLTMRVSATDATAMRKEVDALLGKDHFAKAGISVSEPRTTENAGATISDRELALDFTRLAGEFNVTLTQMGRITNEQFLEALFGGSRIPLRVATKDDLGVFAIGKQQDAALMAALDGSARQWSKPVQEALARVADCNPLLVERIDMVALLAGFSRMVKKLDDTLPIPDSPAAASGSFVVSAGIRDGEWRVGLSLDLAGIVKFVLALQPR